jgi:type VI protein secretion system component VasK
MFRFSACLVLLLLLLGVAHAGMNADSKYTEKGQADFDTLHQRALDLYGVRLAVEGHAAP